VATTFAVGGTSLHELLTDNLGWMQVAMSSMDVLETGGDLDGAQEKERAITMIGFGTGGPPVVAGALLLMYQVALVLFIGLGPIFILCLLFNATRSLFHRWLLYGIGTMFSLAVLSAMASIALRMVTDVAQGMWAADALGSLFLGGGGDAVGYSSRALQTGGMGLILTLLLITVPPMAANFFQGTLGQFAWGSAFAGGAAASQLGPGGQAPGTPGYFPQAYRPPQPGGDTSGGAPTNIDRSLPHRPNQRVPNGWCWPSADLGYSQAHLIVP
jgi:type IV secretion system protein VirB6